MLLALLKRKLGYLCAGRRSCLPLELVLVLVLEGLVLAGSNLLHLLRQTQTVDTCSSPVFTFQRSDHHGIALKCVLAEVFVSVNGKCGHPICLVDDLRADPVDVELQSARSICLWIDSLRQKSACINVEI